MVGGADEQQSRLVDLISDRISDLARSKEKKQAPKPVVQLAEELKALKEGLKPKVKSLIGILNGLIMDDAEMDWVKIADRFVEVSKRIPEDEGGRFALVADLSERRLCSWDWESHHRVKNGCPGEPQEPVGRENT